jgi:Tol biopolymer transport system component
MTESTTNRVLADWLQEGPDRGSNEALERALAATRRSSQRPGWAIPERWNPMQLTAVRVPNLRPLYVLTLVALLIVALAVAAALVGRPRELPNPFGLAANGVTVFEQSGDLMVASELGGEPRPLVTGDTKDFYPAFSQQGDQIAFLRSVTGGSLLMSVRPDGSNVKTLGGPYVNVDGFRWSPDGSQILVGSNDGSFYLEVVQADGSGTRRLELGTPADWGSWRPDGRLIAFRGQANDGVQAAAAFVANADGSNVRRLDIQAHPTSGVDFEGLRWSPDGTHLGFMSGGELGGTTGWQIVIADVSAAGSVTDVRRLKLIPDSTGEMLPVWSPDGSQIAFIAEEAGYRRIALVAGDGTGQVRRVGPTTPRSTSSIGYAWSPDGATLLLTFGPQRFWSVDTATGVETVLDGPTVEIPTWQRLAP